MPVNIQAMRIQLHNLEVEKPYAKIGLDNPMRF